MLLTGFEVRVRRTKRQISQFVQASKERCDHEQNARMIGKSCACAMLDRKQSSDAQRKGVRAKSCSIQLQELVQPTDAHTKSACTSGNPCGYIMSHCFSHIMFPMHLSRQAMSGKHCASAKHASSCISHFWAKHKSQGLTGSEPGHDGAQSAAAQLDAIVNSANPTEFVA